MPHPPPRSPAALFGRRILSRLGLRLALAAFATLLALAALGFLLAALYLGLAAGLGAPLAALVMGLFLAPTAIVLFLLVPRTAVAPEGGSVEALAPLLARGLRGRPLEMLLLALLAGALLERFERRSDR